MAEFLLEIGVEELPASWLPELISHMKFGFQAAANKQRLIANPTTLESFATPRRLTVRADLPVRQETVSTRTWGPSANLAREKDGSWSKAAIGFARKLGIAPQDLTTGAKDPHRQEDLYLCFEARAEARSTFDLLPATIAAVLATTHFPKRMNWDAWLDYGDEPFGFAKGPFPFGRPIRWILALLDSQVVPFTIHSMRGGQKGDARVQSGPFTYGHRHLPRGDAGGPIEVRSFNQYVRELARHFVIISPHNRTEAITSQLSRYANEATLSTNHLVQEWANLVEYPTVVTSEIPQELFDRVPREVVETVLIHHQRCVPFVDANGLLLPRFAGISNADQSSLPRIRLGLDRVIAARLRDAAFFYQQDLKTRLERRVDALAGVTFHQKVGSYKDKTERLVRLVEAFGPEGWLPEGAQEESQQAARMSKADLTTLMVGEFPELQGVMGGIYLREGGHAPPSVWWAVHRQYQPISVKRGDPPAGYAEDMDYAVWSALVLADRIDTLVGLFGVGLAPSGSSDPYGLRRAGNAIFRVLLEFWPKVAKPPNVRDLTQLAFAGYRSTQFDASVSEDSLLTFLLDRFRYVLGAHEPDQQYRPDEIEAVLAAYEQPLNNPLDCYARLKALHRIRSESPADFAHLAVAFKRASSLLAQAEKEARARGVMSTLGIIPEVEDLTEPAERELLSAVTQTRDSYPGSDDVLYDRLLRSLSRIRPAVDRFFDEVMVMVEDPKVRRRRLELLHFTIAPILRIADISKLGG